MQKLFGLVFLVLITLPGSGRSESHDAMAVMTQQQQQALSPDEVAALLRAGNGRFVSGNLTSRDHSAQVRAAASGQFPKAMILSCVDSRVPVEDVFDLGIGDIFVARVAGNFENVDILGSMEFATRVSGAKLIVVLGHEECGAVKAAIDDVKLGNITAMLENIRPAVESLSSYRGDRSSANAEFVHMVAVENIRLTIDRIRERSPILKEMEAKSELGIVGALYDMKTGRIEFID
jgi:carbonic anhydrase